MLPWDSPRPLGVRRRHAPNGMIRAPAVSNRRDHEDAVVQPVVVHGTFDGTLDGTFDETFDGTFGGAFDGLFE